MLFCTKTFVAQEFDIATSHISSLFKTLFVQKYVYLFLDLEKRYLNDMKNHEIIELVKREVVTAIGCTEPIAVALCTAKAVETLGCLPQKIEARLSANILKNAMGVGIPATGMTGLPIAIALGASVGKSEYGLEVLRDVTPEAVEEGKKYIDDGRVDVKLKNGECDILYIEIEVSDGEQTALAVISGSHTNFVRVERCGEPVTVGEGACSEAEAESDLPLTMRTVYDFCMTAPLEDIEFIMEAARLNKAAAEASFKGEYGHSLGRTILTGQRSAILGDGVFSRILAYTSGACDARMSGAMIPVMSNSGSGNQGISATMPGVVYAEEMKASHEQFVRALMLSHLTVIYIKQSLGRLSALCGCVVAATGSSCGLVHLMGGGYEEITYAVKNMIANLTGMICDGAKPSCAMKVTSGISTAVMSAMLAMEHRVVQSTEGIIDDDVDRSILNLTRIGREGMTQTDSLILDIMTHK